MSWIKLLGNDTNLPGTGDAILRSRDVYMGINGDNGYYKFILGDGRHAIAKNAFPFYIEINNNGYRNTLHAATGYSVNNAQCFSGGRDLFYKIENRWTYLVNEPTRVRKKTD